MKGSVSRGTGFRGLSEYLLQEKTGEPRHGARIVGGNMAGTTPRELSAEFRMSRELRPEVARPVWHCSLTLPAGETLSDQQWEDVARGLMQKIGMDPDLHQHVLVRHQDTDHDHVHIQATRIGLDSSLWHGKWEARAVIEATQELEREHGLTLTPGLRDERAERKRLSKQEMNMAVRTGEEPPRQRLQRLVVDASHGKPTASGFVTRLRAQGVSVRANVSENTGRLSGFSFALDGVPFKGSDLGKGYTWAGLQKAGVSYDPARDLDVLLLRNKPEESDQQHEIKTPPVQAPEPRPRNYLEEATQNCKKRDTDVYFLDKKPNFEQQIVVKKAEKEKRTLTKEQKQEIKDIVSRYGIIEEIDYEYSKVDGCEYLQYEYTNDKELADLMQKELLYQLQIDRNYILSQIEDEKQEPEPEKKKERNYIEEATQNFTSEEKIQRCLMLENDNYRNEEYIQAISELSGEETKMLFDEMQRRNDEEMKKNMHGFDEKSSKYKIDWSL